MEWKKYIMGNNPHTRRRERLMNYTYDDYCEGIESLAKQISKKKLPDYLCGIQRAGLIVCAHLSYRLGVPMVALDRKNPDSLEFAKKILTDQSNSIIMVDEIIDSGESADTVNRYFLRNFKWACLVFNTSQKYITDSYYHVTIDRTVDQEWVHFHWGGD